MNETELEKSALEKLQIELDDVKSVAAVLEVTKQEEIAELKIKYEGEIATLERILKEAVADALHTGQRERAELKQANQALQLQLHDARHELSRLDSHYNEDGLLSGVLRSLRVAGSSPSSPNLVDWDAPSEADCQSGGAQNPAHDESGDLAGTSALSGRSPALDRQSTSNGAAYARALVRPFQEEIAALHKRVRSTEFALRSAENKVRVYEKRFQEEMHEEGLEGGLTDSITKQQTKGDLQILVGVLNTQKSVLQEDIELLKEKLNSLHSIFNKSYQEVAQVRLLCQRSGTPILPEETSTLHTSAASPSVLYGSIPDRLGKVEKILKSSLLLFRMGEDDDVAALDETHDGKPAKLIEYGPTPTDSPRRIRSSSLTGADSADEKDAGASDGEDSGIVSGAASARAGALSSETSRKSRSLDHLNSGGSEDSVSHDKIPQLVLEPPGTSADVSSVAGGGVEKYPGGSLGVGANDQRDRDSLDGAAQHGSVASSDPETSSRLDWDSSYSGPEVLVGTASGPSAGAGIDGAAGGCDMCTNYELKLQQAQDCIKKLTTENSSSKVLIDRYKSDLEREQQFRTDIENRTATLSEDLGSKVESMFNQTEQNQTDLSKIQEEYSDNFHRFSSDVTELLAHRTTLLQQLQKLEQQYDSLLGHTAKRAEEMRNELIDLPESPESLQEFCLKLREELIEAKATKEHIEETMKADNMFLRSQVESEHNAKTQIEDNLTEEINQLRTHVGLAQSQNSQLQEEIARLKNVEKSFVDSKTEKASASAELSLATGKIAALEIKLAEARNKNCALTEDLNNSEYVQKDFVKLSQSLQVELEKIRAAEQEVRWQFDEDVLVCNGPCKGVFNRQRRKDHCRHCGKIFCPQCLCRTVPSGPAGRPAPVCDVCHTILVQYSKPYFSDLPP